MPMKTYCEYVLAIKYTYDSDMEYERQQCSQRAQNMQRICGHFECGSRWVRASVIIHVQMCCSILLVIHRTIVLNASGFMIQISHKTFHILNGRYFELQFQKIAWKAPSFNCCVRADGNGKSPICIEHISCMLIKLMLKLEYYEIFLSLNVVFVITSSIYR